MTVLFSPEAEEDFATLIAYLADRSPERAAALGRRIFAVLDKLDGGELDGSGQTLSSGELVHSWPVPPVRIYYQRHPDAFWVLRIYHQARTPIVP